MYALKKQLNANLRGSATRNAETMRMGVFWLHFSLNHWLYRRESSDFSTFNTITYLSTVMHLFPTTTTGSLPPDLNRMLEECKSYSKSDMNQNKQH